MLSNIAQTYYYETQSDSSGGGYEAGFIVVVVLLSILLYVFGAIILGLVFKKAGQKMWPAWVPIYNTWLLMEISGKPGWWALISLVPWIGSIIFFVLYIIAMLELAKRFGKDVVFAVFGLVIFGFVGFVMLAFGKATYSADGELPSSAPLSPPVTQA